MFSFSILQSVLRFADVEVIAIPTTRLVNNFRSVGTIQAIFAGKERFDSPSVKKNNFEINDIIKLIYVHKINYVIFFFISLLAERKRSSSACSAEQ